MSIESRLKKIARPVLSKIVPLVFKDRGFSIRVHKANPGTWVATNAMGQPKTVKSLPLQFRKIEARAEKTSAAGALPLWEGYAALENYPGDVSSAAMRTSDQVRTARRTGEFYTWLVTSVKPAEIVEIGSAFGISGMYWCAGLAANGEGNFTGFEPNNDWAPYARANIQSILDRARLVLGTFEDNVDQAPDKIDLAFIDAIHTPEFVDAQLALVLERANKGALIILDDINFSPSMSNYWRRIRDDTRFAAAVEVTSRVGILELSR